MSCELCDTIDWKESETYRIVECNHCHVPMLVLREHRQFTEFEKELILGMLKANAFCPDIGPFWGPLTELERRTIESAMKVRVDSTKKIRWEQRKIKDHGHCHFE